MTSNRTRRIIVVRILMAFASSAIVLLGCQFTGYSEHEPTTLLRAPEQTPLDVTATDDGIVLVLEKGAPGIGVVKAFKDNVFLASVAIDGAGFEITRIDGDAQPGVLWVAGGRGRQACFWRYSFDGRTFRHLTTRVIDIPGQFRDFAAAEGVSVYRDGVYVLSHTFGSGLYSITHDTLPCDGPCLRSFVHRSVLPDTGEPLVVANAGRRGIAGFRLAVDRKTGDLHLPIYDRAVGRNRLYTFPRGDLARGVRSAPLEAGARVLDLSAHSGLLMVLGSAREGAPRSVRALLFSRAHGDFLSESFDGTGSFEDVMSLAGYASPNPPGCDRNGALVYTHGFHSWDSVAQSYNRFGRHAFCFGSPADP